MGEGVLKSQNNTRWTHVQMFGLVSQVRFTTILRACSRNPFAERPDDFDSGKRLASGERCVNRLDGRNVFNKTVQIR